MSAEGSVRSFDEWLSQKLSVLGTDPEVFGNYITGILTGEESESEKRDALEDVMSGVTESNIPDLCCEIMKEWANAQSALNGLKEKIISDGENDVGAKLATIMEKQAQAVVRESMHTAEEKMMRDAILAQYSHVSDEDDDYFSDTAEERASSTNTAPSSTLPRNENAHSVAQAEKEKREKAKAESEKKKAQDKLNREKQKQQQQERKDREKKRTQKGERKR